jgi:inosose dehydratase
MKLAGAPVNWGVDFAGTPGNPPYGAVLDGIAAAGLDALELGPVGYLPEDPGTLRAELAARRLHAIGSFVFEPLHERALLPQILDTTRRACRAIVAAGGQVLVIVPQPADEPVHLPAVDAIAEIARDHGLEPLLHPHAGTSLEREDAIERALDATGLAVCADTAHLAYAGIDPARWIRAHATLVRHIHLKDLCLDRRRDDFWTAVEAGVFVPLGEGDVDLAEVLAALDDIAYEGHAVIEQDRVPGSGDPVADVRRSVAHIRSLAGP